MILIEGVDYFLYFIRLPGSIDGIVTKNDDDTYTIFLNQDLCGDRLLDAYIHEILHILRDDLEGEKDVRVIERMCA